MEGAPAAGEVVELGPQRPPETSLSALADDFLAAVDLSDNTRRAYGQPRSRQAERQARPIPLDELQALWSGRRHDTRDQVLWRLLYDSAARAREVLDLNIEDIDFAKKRGTIVGKGGDAEMIQWSTDTARVLPAILRWHHLRRESGPVFLSNRRLDSRGVPARDLCPLTGRPRLSYNRGAAVFKEASGGRTLHQLRHSRLDSLGGIRGRCHYSARHQQALIVANAGPVCPPVARGGRRSPRRPLAGRSVAHVGEMSGRARRVARTLAAAAIGGFCLWWVGLAVWGRSCAAAPGSCFGSRSLSAASWR